MVGKKLPRVSGSRVCKALQKDGFKRAGTKGSHIKLKKRLNLENEVLIVTVPNHEELAYKTLINILKQAKLTRDDFFELLKK